MKIGFIGAGKVGFSLGKFFTQGGIPVTGYYSRHRDSAKEAAIFTGTKQYDELEGFVSDSDALFLTVPDGEITSVYQEVRKFHILGKIICHCSGVMTAGEAFPAISQTGAYAYSIHPLFPFSSKYETYRELPGAFFCLEGDGPHIDAFRDMFQRLGISIHVLSGDQKVKYHAACAISSNLVCALVQESLELLGECGFPKELALKALTPLIQSNITHILNDGPMEALTGPVERGDVSTVKKHLDCFNRDEERELYRVVSKKLAELAVCKNPDRDYSVLNELL